MNIPKYCTLQNVSIVSEEELAIRYLTSCQRRALTSPTRCGHDHNNLPSRSLISYDELVTRQ